MHGLSLCSGVGGLELGLGLAIDGYRCVGYVERDAFAAVTLVARMEDAALDPAPVWDDLTTFDGSAWRGCVDLVSAGFPCQPWSVAGSRKGTDDERWLWPSIATIIRDVGPSCVFLENVPGLVAGGLEHVLGDLAALGFAAEWNCFSAAEVGAPQRRLRLFILAQRVPDADSTDLRAEQGRRESERTGEAEPRNMVKGLGDADGRGRQGERLQKHAEQQRPCGCESHRCGDERTQLWTPGPDCRPEDWPANVPQPAIRRGSDGTAYRVDRLRAVGNGVVPLVAAHAFRTLTARVSRGSSN